MISSVSVATQSWFCLIRSKTHKDRFPHDIKSIVLMTSVNGIVLLRDRYDKSPSLKMSCTRGAT